MDQLPISRDAPQQSFQFREDASILSPREMIELERPETGVANSVGDLALLPVTQHSLSDGKSKRHIYIVSLDLETTSFRHPFLDEGEAFWLDSRTIGYVKTSEASNQQEIYAVSLQHSTGGSFEPVSPTLVGKLPPGASAANFKYLVTQGTLVFSAYVYDDEDLDTVQDQDDTWKESKVTARAYDSLYVRHWDRYIGPKHSSLFTVRLHKENGVWSLEEKIHAPLKGTRHSVPVEPFGGPKDFDIHDVGLVYTTKDPTVNEATHTRQNIYLVPSQLGERPRHLTSGNQGATSNPAFSHDGTKVVWLEMATDGYESDQNFVTIYDLAVERRFTVDFHDGGELPSRWDRSPSAVTWSLDDKSLYITVGDSARVKIFQAKVPLTPTTSETGEWDPVVKAPLPIPFTQEHAAGGVQCINDGLLLFTRSSLLSPNNLYILSGLANSGKARPIHQLTKFGEPVLKDKKLSDYEEFWFEGAEGARVQGWSVKPAGWSKDDSSATWPMIFLIHGGPQGAWEDQWSTRWNPMVFAQQGYFVVAINPTGSTTFGQSFTDAIAKDWGGRPFIDLSRGYKHALRIFPEIDCERTVAAGASWGGFAINWIAGHQEKYGFNFKALITHDGIFDTRFGGYVTEELFFFMHEFGGPPYDPEVIKNAEQFNPANHVSKWNTPHLIIHGTKDYRLPITDALAGFTALQLKSVPSRLVVFEEENHWVLRPENSLRWHEEVFSWVHKYVGRGSHYSKSG
ncbi:alpha/beta-hydrolase [Cantharellus anzutake]|uniref:alpha/beta-hydrolase n=1 Tax=Cantharellus anzutake TaxID=1750568 RepID=UPI0019044C00|nr:alpha/beta-hydrolase [Cantharellus anzutake]KAF8333551.1 alpha/beta-hydrolase [Cantharellus anzutake]